MPRGVEAVAGFGVIDLALHDFDEEADYEPAVVRLLADDVGEGYGDFFGLVFRGEHMFYGNGCRRLGSRGNGGEGGSCGSRKVHSTVPSSLSDSDQQDEDHDNPNYILAEPKVGTGWQKRREGLSTILLVTRLAAAQANLPPLGPVPGFD